jgi:hypothetical protein
MPELTLIPGAVMNPLIEAIAEALGQHEIDPDANDPAQEADTCTCGELVDNWDEHMAEVAADVAVGLLGTDRCVHSRDVHYQHHAKPVDGCPWCTALPKPEQLNTVDVPSTGELL